MEKNLGHYIFRRALQALPLFFGISILTFLIVYLSPIDPVIAYFGADVVLQMPEEDVAKVKQELGLDEPVYMQYFLWLKRVCQGDLGFSRTKHRPVLDVIVDRFPATLLLTVTGYSISVILGIIIGVLSAAKEGSLFDRLSLTLNYILYSTPSFLIALMAILIFVVWLGWLPPCRMTSVTVETSSLLFSMIDRIKHLVLPALVLGMSHLAIYATYIRSGMLESLHKDYIITARAKGLHEWTITHKHAFRNALLPFITQLGLSIPWLISGSVVIETIFAWPGIGRLAYDAALRADYTVLMGLTLFTGTLVIFGNLLADIAYAIVDPRVKYD
ncbi:MAG: ABC transporter permease [Methanophagales archaeon]|nr:ABC transporter permease [Methanophagales archaeon]